MKAGRFFAHTIVSMKGVSMYFANDRLATISSEPTEENREGEAIYTRQKLVDEIAILAVRQFRRQRENPSQKNKKSREEQRS